MYPRYGVNLALSRRICAKCVVSSFERSDADNIYAVTVDFNNRKRPSTPKSLLYLNVSSIINIYTKGRANGVPDSNRSFSDSELFDFRFSRLNVRIYERRKRYIYTYVRTYTYEFRVRDRFI